MKGRILWNIECITTHYTEAEGLHARKGKKTTHQMSNVLLVEFWKNKWEKRKPKQTLICKV